MEYCEMHTSLIKGIGTKGHEYHITNLRGWTILVSSRSQSESQHYQELEQQLALHTVNFHEAPPINVEIYGKCKKLDGFPQKEEVQWRLLLEFHTKTS
jgi:hypothetical protein